VRSNNIKEQLIQAAVELIMEAEVTGSITARQIAGRANVNLAMINYYFSSKDNLISEAIGRTIESSANKWKEMLELDIPPKEKLRLMLYELCDMVVEQSRFTRVSILHIITQQEISQPYYILPILKDFYGSRKNELELKVIAYELISFLQLVFLRSKDFYRYCGADITDDRTRHSLIDMQIDLFLVE
jgi:Uncharacterized protein conserved in bacteria